MMQVEVHFGQHLWDAIQPYKREMTIVGSKKVIRGRCDLAVGAFAMDSVEAVSTYGAKTRFYCPNDNEKHKTQAGCTLCKTPTYFYDHKASELQSNHFELRNSVATEEIRGKDVGKPSGNRARDDEGVWPLVKCTRS